MDRKKKRMSDQDEMQPLGNQKANQTLSDNPTEEERIPLVMGLSRKSLVIIGVVLVVLLVAVAVILGLILSQDQSIPNDVILGEEILEEGSKLSCKNDGFADLPPFSNSFNKQFNLKYKILERSSFVAAFQKCETLGDGAHLWQIIQGQPEWEAMLDVAKKANAADMWINAQVIGDCPGVEYHCHKDTALDGNGISIRYPLNEKATYSRLYRAPSTDMNCVLSEDSTGNLWTTDSCKNLNHTGICVKRNCLHE